jgi:hypothetical protein
MTPKDKAKKLLDKYYIEHYCWSGNGYDVDKVTTKQCQKQCALIAVDEILNHHSQEQSLYRIDTYYWEQVKKEIEKL